MDELRDNIVARIKANIFPLALGRDKEASIATRLADDILALPGIAEALNALAERRIDAMSPSRFGAAAENAKHPRSPGPKPDSRSA